MVDFGLKKIGEDCAVYVSHFVGVDEGVIVLWFWDCFFNIGDFVKIFIDKVGECDIG